MKNIKFRTKLWLALGFFAIIIFTIGSLVFIRISLISNDMQNIGDNRIPDMDDFQAMNFERMHIRTITYQVWLYQHTENAQNEFKNILKERNETWSTIDKYWSNILQRERKSEAEQQLITRLDKEYKDWRGIYVELDGVIQKLSETYNAEEKASLYIARNLRI